MNLFEELNRVAARLAPYENPLTCTWCGNGTLRLIDETPDPIFGTLGVSCQTLRCDDPACGKLTII
jgi:hypothetical protein